MRCELVSLEGGDPTTLAAGLRALLPAAEEVAAAVAEIIERVRANGDEAVLEYTRMFDTNGRAPLPLRVAATELTTRPKRWTLRCVEAWRSRPTT